MDEPNLIAAAIPFFFALIGVELVVAVARGRKVFRFADAITDLSCGIGNQVVDVFAKGFLILPYLWLYENGRLWTLGGATAWVVAFLGVDLAYYWWHRLSHEINFIWAAHVVHHQSEDYNLAVALRQAWFTPFTGWIFRLPLAVLGVPPAVYVANEAISLLYQFWIHTQLIGRMGPLEWVMNTPSHHRVHHGINPRYLDKNYAGILIVWDRMFGTFEPESEPVVYGTVKKTNSFNPIWANFTYWAYLIRDAVAARTVDDRVRVWFEGPEFRPENLPQNPPAPPVHPDTFDKYEPRVSGAIKLYVFANFVPVVLATTTLIAVAGSADLGTKALLAVLIVMSTLAFGGLFENKRWAWPLEITRLATVAVAAVIALQ